MKALNCSPRTFPHLYNERVWFQSLLRFLSTVVLDESSDQEGWHQLPVPSSGVGLRLFQGRQCKALGKRGERAEAWIPTWVPHCPGLSVMPFWVKKDFKYFYSSLTFEIPKISLLCTPFPVSHRHQGCKVFSVALALAKGVSSYGPLWLGGQVWSLIWPTEFMWSLLLILGQLWTHLP